MTYDGDYGSRAAEGLNSAVVNEIKRLIKDSIPTFSRMVILEVISDPQIIDENKIGYWKNVLRVANMSIANVLPRNTVVAQKIRDGITTISPPMFMLPFFPSHLSLPCKPGEMVWTMFENPNARIKEVGYWVCRITEPHFADDVNHTHHARILDHSFNSTTIKKAEGTDNPVYELRNGKVNRSKDGSRFVVQGTNVIPSTDQRVFENLITTTDAARIIQYEPVPRFRKRPGDVALEGSNNTLIVLGTDRTGPAYEEDVISDENGGTVPAHPEADVLGYAGSIDIVAGRGTKPETGGKAAVTQTILDGEELKKELGKSNNELEEKEGDPDLINDRSRILVSQKTRPDTNFGLSEYMFKSYGISDDGNDSSVVIKSDKVRIIARSDISFIVTNWNPDVNNETGNAFKSDNLEEEKWASITIKSTGDIVFTPSSSGLIKLGGDDASQAILCTSRPFTSIDGGAVQALPVATTGGGFIGTDGGNVDSDAINFVRAPDLGTVSRKVLIK